jgi:hypothetical protein
MSCCWLCEIYGLCTQEKRFDIQSCRYDLPEVCEGERVDAR